MVLNGQLRSSDYYFNLNEVVVTDEKWCLVQEMQQY